MAEKLVTLRHDQNCDICHRKIAAGEQAYMIRDDFWPMNVFFEHKGGCPDEPAAAHGKAAPKGTAAAKKLA